MLINLAKAAFEAVSWPTTIATGRYMFSLGDNNRNVGDEQVVEPDGGFLHNNKQMASMLSVSDTFGGQHPML